MDCQQFSNSPNNQDIHVKFKTDRKRVLTTRQTSSRPELVASTVRAGLAQRASKSHLPSTSDRSRESESKGGGGGGMGCQSGRSTNQRQFQACSPKNVGKFVQSFAFHEEIVKKVEDEVG